MNFEYFIIIQSKKKKAILYKLTALSKLFLFSANLGEALYTNFKDKIRTLIIKFTCFLIHILKW